VGRSPRRASGRLRPRASTRVGEAASSTRVEDDAARRPQVAVGSTLVLGWEFDATLDAIKVC